VRPKKERLANSTYGKHVTRISKEGHAFLLPTKMAALDTLLANIDKASSCLRETKMTKREERDVAKERGYIWCGASANNSKN
jgi:hypothetical protein